MNKQIESEIKKFEELQKKFTSLGADDSEPDSIFQMMIAMAVTKDPIQVGEDIDWDLYEHSDADVAAQQMTLQAWKVYDSILKFAGAVDLEALKKYCWRLDESEFTAWADSD
jgi:hypothetical protein